MTALQEKIAAGDGDVKALSKRLYDILQEAGPYLANASVPLPIALKKRTMTTKQVTDDRRISGIISKLTLAKPDKTGGPRLQVVGTDSRYTILFLSVPITVKGPPEAIVYFESEAGGHFQSNGLAVAEVKTDKAGLATVNWISDGDAAGHCFVNISSPTAVNRDLIQIKVVDLKIMTPAGFKPSI